MTTRARRRRAARSPVLWRLRTDIAVSIKRPCLPALASPSRGATRTYPPRHGFRTQEEDAPVWYSSRGAVADASIDALSDKFGDLECAVQVSSPRQASAFHHPERWFLDPALIVEYATSWTRRVQPARRLLLAALPYVILRPLRRPIDASAVSPRNQAPAARVRACGRAPPALADTST